MRLPKSRPSTWRLVVVIIPNTIAISPLCECTNLMSRFLLPSPRCRTPWPRRPSQIQRPRLRFLFCPGWHRLRRWMATPRKAQRRRTCLCDRYRRCIQQTRRSVRNGLTTPAMIPKYRKRNYRQRRKCGSVKNANLGESVGSCWLFCFSWRFPKFQMGLNLWTHLSSWVTHKAQCKDFFRIGQIQKVTNF